MPKVHCLISDAEVEGTDGVPVRLPCSGCRLERFGAEGAGLGVEHIGV